MSLVLPAMAENWKKNFPAFLPLHPVEVLRFPIAPPAEAEASAIKTGGAPVQ